MCIRDRLVPTPIDPTSEDYDKNMNDYPDFREKPLFEGIFGSFTDAPGGFKEEMREISFSVGTCLLYTSDAADERSSVALGGRRIIKKKYNTHVDHDSW